MHIEDNLTEVGGAGRDPRIVTAVNSLEEAILGRANNYYWIDPPKDITPAIRTSVLDLYNTVAIVYQEKGLSIPQEKDLTWRLNRYVDRVWHAGEHEFVSGMREDEDSILKKPRTRRTLNGLLLTFPPAVIATHLISEAYWAWSHGYKQFEFWITKSLWNDLLNTPIGEYLQKQTPLTRFTKPMEASLFDEHVLMWYAGHAPLICLGLLGVGIGSLYYFGSPARARRRINEFRKIRIPELKENLLCALTESSESYNRI